MSQQDSKRNVSPKAACQWSGCLAAAIADPEKDKKRRTAIRLSSLLFESWKRLPPVL